MRRNKSIKIIIGAAVMFLAALYISTNLYQVMLIQGDSMLPTYHSWQFTLLDKRIEDFYSGDVVAFTCDGAKGVLVKRIVAVPGDSVQIKDKILYVNGSPVEQELVTAELNYSGIAEQKIILSEEEYFLLGDNYEYSKDSRYEEIGCIRQEQILGKVIPQRKNQDR